MFNFIDNIPSMIRSMNNARRIEAFCIKMAVMIPPSAEEIHQEVKELWDESSLSIDQVLDYFEEYYRERYYVKEND